MLINLLLHQVTAIKTLNLKEAFGTELLIKRAITRQEFSDFYALDAIAPLVESNSTQLQKLSPEMKNKIGDILSRRNKLIWDIANYYYKSMHTAIVGEYYSGNPKWPTTDDEKIAKLKSVNINASGLYQYSQVFDVTDVQKFNAKQLIVGFENLDFYSQYGGAPWANIARLYKELGEILKELKSTVGDHKIIKWHIDGTFKIQLNKLVQLIDRINQAEHNNGSLFTHFQGDEYSWITDALNEKAIPNSMQKLKENVSPDLKNIVEELDPVDHADPLEIAAQIGEVQLYKWQANREHQIKRDFDDAVRSYTSSLRVGNLEKSQYDRYMRSLNNRLIKDMENIKNPDSGDSLVFHLTTKLKDPNTTLAILLKHKYIKNIRSFIDLTSMYKINPDLLIRAIKIDTEVRNKIIINLFNHATYTGNAPHTEEVIELFYNLLSNMDEQRILSYSNGLLFDVVKLFRARDLNSSRLYKILKDSADNKQMDLNLPLFAANRNKRLKKLAIF